MLEYGLILATVAVLALIGGALFGDTLTAWLNQLVQRITASP
jgi:Flp pilus assembly pilin Flp